MERLERREMLSASPWMADAEMYDYFISNGAATDSASAATAMSTGIKTDSGNIAWASGDPSGGELTMITESLRAEKDFAIGVVSTVPFSHATPAAFSSHNVKRSNKWDIADEVLFDTQPEVVIGGGLNSYFAKATRDAAGNDQDLDNNGFNDEYDSFVAGSHGTPYVFVERMAGVDGGDALASAAAGVDLAAGEKLFGLFGTSGGHWDYYDVANDPGNPSLDRPIEDPTLADAAQVTLEVLSQDEDGLFVMFEQGDVDWNNHANDYEHMIGGVYDLDQAVRTAEEFVNQRGDDINWNNTLMIVTSDHSNSYTRLHEYLGKGELPNQIEYGINPADKADGTQVTYSSRGHTNELVAISARGRGAQLFEQYAGADYRGKNIVDNIHIYEVMSEAADMGVSNIILFIGDGMNLEHEIAGSRYLTGQDFGLAWHDWGLNPQGFSGFCTTWDVQTYNHYADLAGQPEFDPANLDANDPILGYDPGKGGIAPERLDRYGAYVSHTLRDVRHGDRPWNTNVQEDLVLALSYRHSDTPGRKIKAADRLFTSAGKFWTMWGED
jgi:alkaline phosphatase